MSRPLHQGDILGLGIFTGNQINGRTTEQLFDPTEQELMRAEGKVALDGYLGDPELEVSITVPEGVDDAY